VASPLIRQGTADRTATAPPHRVRRLLTPGKHIDTGHAVTVSQAHHGNAHRVLAHGRNIAEHAERDGILRSFEVVEVNPILDSHNETAELAVSALGKRVL
jgi:hypothetical protein